MNKLHIGPRLAVAFGAVLLVTAMIALIGVTRLGDLKGSSLKGQSYELVQVGGIFRLEAVHAQSQRLLA